MFKNFVICNVETVGLKKTEIHQLESQIRLNHRTSTDIYFNENVKSFHPRRKTSIFIPNLTTIEFLDSLIFRILEGLNTRDMQKKYAQFILTDPLTLEEIFITEKYLDYVWAGVNDRTTWYPMFNSFIDYIRENSKTYK